MFNISIIDSNYTSQIKLIESCKSILKNTSFVIQPYSTLEEFQMKDSYYAVGHILIVNEKFLDIQSIQTLKTIQSQFKNLHILFYGHNIYSILEAHEMDHFYFVMIDQLEERLPLALQKGMQLIKEGYHPFFSTSFKNKYFKIYYDDVIQIHFSNRQIRFVTVDDEYVIYISKKNFLNIIDEKIFLQVCHNQLINLDYVKHYEKPYFILYNNEKIQAGSTYLPMIDHLFANKNLCMKSKFIQ